MGNILSFKTVGRWKSLKVCLGRRFENTFENSLWRNIILSYKCDQCNFASVRTDNLKRHLTSRSGEKSNKCNLCNFASAREANLWNHLKTYLAQMVPGDRHPASGKAAIWAPAIRAPGRMFANCGRARYNDLRMRMAIRAGKSKSLIR